MIASPILLFTYKRLNALEKTITALKKNDLAEETELFIFSDGPKHESDYKKIKDVRAFLKTIKGFKNVTIKESNTNNGLANSIISGVTEVLTFSESVIVLEDDLLATTNFLTYMNTALTKYKNIQKVFSISGYSFDLGLKSPSIDETYFLYRGWSWGWATWRDRWSDIGWEVKDYESFKNDKKRKAEFAQGGSDVNKMLQSQMEGSLDSWAIRWFYHQFKVDGLTLYPVYSKIYNNGFDDFATHTKGSNKRYLPLLDTSNSSNILFPDTEEVKSNYQKAFLKKMGLWSRIKSKIEGLLP
ncbi:hypothetical protein MNBD_BACTEROID03-184 [hydrothermal vent metagenome]|uniref:Uncharacterized protein n=1 Tax=hydrothermal vent metagenome TaxID=652676 RepID=A0A3B0T7C7_9ZZZZ